MQSLTDERRRTVFRAVVREYLRSAEPVGSSTIALRYEIDVSPATIRNDMADLEEQGLLEQPHTSAGRVPSEEGYRYYVSEFVRDAVLAERERERVAAAAQALERAVEAEIRAFAKAIADLTGETVFIRIGDTGVVAGVSNLVRKPEFREEDLAGAVSLAVDDLEGVARELERRLRADIDVLIGEENPFGRGASAVVALAELPGFGEGVVGVLGPKRMDYDANVALMRAVHELLHHHCRH
jgi:transcriptional regulator of heat shock response